jgi:CRP/FNR family cyclic AMP-dependent transcriptional regulator
MKTNRSSNKIKSNGGLIFNAPDFLASAGVPGRVMLLQKPQEAYAQGDPATSVMYIQEGKVKLSVVNELGKEAIVAILGPTDFFGDGCLANQPVRMETATALMPTTVSVIQKSEMMRAIHSDRAFSDRFMSYLVSRKLRLEEDLIDQLFNNSEKRLARALLRLTRYDQQELPEEELPKVSQEMLSEMVGTTRSRVNSFMSKFRKLGYIEYGDGLHVKPSLMNVLQE